MDEDVGGDERSFYITGLCNAIELVLIVKVMIARNTTQCRD